jgi:hypothetical protein
MKATLTLFVLISMILAKNNKIKVKLESPSKADITPKKANDTPKKDLPDDIKQGEEFLKKSAQDFDKIKQMSALQAMQNSVIDQNWDLSIPKLENDLESENLAPVRQLELKDDSKVGDKTDSADNRKLEDDDKLDDVEKRLFSIEDKIDHLLLHVGHEIQPQKAVFTPWGLTFSPSHHNKKSLHNKLKTVDYLLGNHPMGGAGLGMGMGGMGSTGMMGIGHMNPMGVGLDHHASMKYGMYPYHMLHPIHPLHSFAPYGMYSPYHTIMGHHPVYGNLGYGMNSFSRYRDDLEEERNHRYMRHQRDMDDILSKPLLPPTPRPDSLSSSPSSSMFLI